MRKTPFGLLATLVICCTLAGDANPPDEFALLESDSQLDRDRGVQLILSKRKETIDRLVRIVREKRGGATHKGPTHCAIVLLGQIRAAEAVHVLVDNIEYVPAFDPMAAVGDDIWYDRFPAVFALGTIGRYSVEPCITAIRLQPEGRKERIVLFARAVTVAYGAPGAAATLRRMIEYVKDEKERANLRIALQYVEAIDRPGGGKK